MQGIHLNHAAAYHYRHQLHQQLKRQRTYAWVREHRAGASGIALLSAYPFESGLEMAGERLK